MPVHHGQAPHLLTCEGMLCVTQAALRPGALQAQPSHLGLLCAQQLRPGLLLIRLQLLQGLLSLHTAGALRAAASTYTSSASSYTFTLPYIYASAWACIAVSQHQALPVI